MLHLVRRVQAHLRSLSSTKAYNMLHLRVEHDWIAHCQRWEGIPDGVVRDNWCGAVRGGAGCQQQMCVGVLCVG